MTARSRSVDSNARQSFGMYLSGDWDPTSGAGQPAEPGALFSQTNVTPPVLWLKQQGAATAWAPIVVTSPITVIFAANAPYVMPAIPVTLPFSFVFPICVYYVRATGGALIDCSALTPQIMPGLIDGQILRIKGLDAVGGGLLFKTGNGLDLNGDVILDENQAIELEWNAFTSVWTEQSRRQ